MGKVEVWSTRKDTEENTPVDLCDPNTSSQAGVLCLVPEGCSASSFRSVCYFSEGWFNQHHTYWQGGVCLFVCLVKSTLFGQCTHSCERSAPINAARPTTRLTWSLTSHLCEPNHARAVEPYNFLPSHIHWYGPSVKHIHQKYKACEKVTLKTHQGSGEQPIHLTGRTPNLFSPLTQLFSAPQGEAPELNLGILSTKGHLFPMLCSQYKGRTLEAPMAKCYLPQPWRSHLSYGPK